ncbi:MAG: DUF4177 domain-containing protein [Planctomycetaceae bacterium]
MMQKWEYRIYNYKQPSGVIFRGAGDVPENVPKDLNALGNEGWEIIASYPVAMGSGATNQIVMILKRPKNA